MKKDDFIDVMGEIDDKFYKEAEGYISVDDIDGEAVEPLNVIPKKSSPLKIIVSVAASLALVGALGTAVHIGTGINVLNPSSEITTEITAENSTKSAAEADNTDESSSEREKPALKAKINPELIYELGMTYSQLAEKYGEPCGGTNTYEFTGGYGDYEWVSDSGTVFEDMTKAGGCNRIDSIDSKRLFLDLNYPVSLDDLADKYNLVPVSSESGNGSGYTYWAEFTCPLYEGVSFVIATTAYPDIDENAWCAIFLDTDCLNAAPINAVPTA